MAHLRLVAAPAVARPLEPSAQPIVVVRLTSDGRLADPGAMDHLAERAAGATDCFLFAPGWLDDAGDTRREAGRFFARLHTGLTPVRDRIRPLRVALHWPSKPSADSETAPNALQQFRDSHVPLAPEEERELDAIRREASPTVALRALGLWTTKRRAGDVGDRFGREWLAPIWAALRPAPRLHVIGHSFGARLVASMVLGGVRPASACLLLGAFSAFAFAREVPGTARPGFYHRLLAQRLVQGRIVIVRSEHDTALSYALRDGIGRVTGRRHVAETVATSALGAAGARGVGAPEVDLSEVPRIGLPNYVIVNVDGSRLMRPTQPVIGAHLDIDYIEVSRTVLVAAGLLEPSPDGLRAPRRSPFAGA